MLLFSSFCVNQRAIDMADEFKKYKDILAREQKEFREEMEREVRTFFAFSIRQKKVGSEPGVNDFVTNFVTFFSLDFMICSLQDNLWVLL